VGDLFTIVEEVEEAVAERNFEKDLNVALMGCAVNGPGEAAGADLGVSLGRGRAHLFKHGENVGTVAEEDIVDAVLEAIENWDEDGDNTGAEDNSLVDTDDTDDLPSESAGDGEAGTDVKKPDLPTP
jgi:(E)-4-hydroxy-3-methylbut-2-enyl-diphosphate synthase